MLRIRGAVCHSKLTAVQYRQPVLGLIFLAYAEHRFEQVRPELEAIATPRNSVTPADYKAKSVLYPPDETPVRNRQPAGPERGPHGELLGAPLGWSRAAEAERHNVGAVIAGVGDGGTSDDDERSGLAADSVCERQQ